jgi:hypothetical protein
MSYSCSPIISNSWESRYLVHYTIDFNGISGSGTGDGSDDVAFDMDEEFTSIRLDEAFNLDPRPNFALRLDSDFEAPFEPVFINTALRSDLQLLKALSFKHRRVTTSQPVLKFPSTDFRSWIKEITHSTNADPCCAYGGVLWTGILLRDQWIIICGDHVTIKHPLNIETQSSMISSQRSEVYKDNPPRVKRALTGSEDASTLLNTDHAPLTTAFVTPGTPDCKYHLLEDSIACLCCCWLEQHLVYHASSFDEYLADWIALDRDSSRARGPALFPCHLCSEHRLGCNSVGRHGYLVSRIPSSSKSTYEQSPPVCSLLG